MKETIVKINKIKSLFFQKIKLTNLSHLIKKKRKKNQINKIRIEKEKLQQTRQKYKGL